MMNAILAIDQSTSATKALLFDGSGNLIDKTALDHRQYYPQPGWVEHDAEEIYANALTVIRTLLDRHPHYANNLLCLSITNQRETIVVFDRATGKPLHHAIVWQCRRGAPLCEALIEAGYAERVQASTGLKIDTYFPAPKLKWLFEHEPDIRAKVRSGQALIGTMDAYLIYRLTGGRTFACDVTNASRTLLYNIQHQCWDEELCALFDVPISALPEVRECSAAFGETTLDGLLNHPLPICGVMGDSQAALFAERCFQPGSAKVTLGTGSSVLLNIGSSFQRSDNGIVTTIAWKLGGNTTYAFEGIINSTGATIAWLRDQLQLITDPRESEVLARSVADNGGVYLVPAFVGLSAPHWRSDVKAAIVGLTPASTKAHVVRAALESIAYQVHDVLTLMASDAELPLQRIHADGGMVSNAFLLQFIADVTGYAVRASSLPELSALGAVYMGMLGAGAQPSQAALEQLPHQTIDYLPSGQTERMTEWVAGWQAAVHQLLIK